MSAYTVNYTVLDYINLEHSDDYIKQNELQLTAVLLNC